MRPPLPRPTDGELVILSVLWTRGPSTVRDIHAALSRERSTGYTSVLKLLQIMIDKGLVTRDESLRSHVYAAGRSREETQQLLVRDLVERAFEGNAAQLVVHALATTPASAEEMQEIRSLLDKKQGARP